jgi:hypothetical protein
MDDFTLDKRIHFLPDLDWIVTVPWSDNLVCLRRLDLAAELDRAGVDYLFVTSRPVATARAGETYRYPINARSRAGGIQFSIDSGPTGMTVSSSGEVTWKAPANARTEDVIVRLADASGQTAYHTFTVTVLVGAGAPVRP